MARDYTQPLEVAEGSMDLLISLFAGPVWENAQRYLRPGAWLLANSSHGDASLAALDPTLRLVGVVQHSGGQYRVTTDGLEWRLHGEVLRFGLARGVSNVLIADRARVRVGQGTLLCVINHQAE